MNNFAIETAQSLSENMLNVPQSELETTVMRFREEVKNLGEPERSPSPEIWCFGAAACHGSLVTASVWLHESG